MTAYLSPSSNELLTVAEVQQALRISRTAAYKLVELGDLASVKIGKTLRIPAASVFAYVEANFRSGPGRPLSSLGTVSAPISEATE